LVFFCFSFSLQPEFWVAVFHSTFDTFARICRLQFRQIYRSFGFRVSLHVTIVLLKLNLQVKKTRRIPPRKNLEITRCCR
jgi:hypothetical protein